MRDIAIAILMITVFLSLLLIEIAELDKQTQAKLIITKPPSQVFFIL